MPERRATAPPPEPAVLFTAVKRLRTSDDIVAQVRDAILAGQLKRGDRLPNERQLCRAFGVSRASLREALRTLEAIGAVEIRLGAKGGIFVSEPDGDQVGSALEALMRFRGVTVAELAEFRTSFEGETASWAALRADERDMEELEELVRRFEALIADDAVPWETFANLDIAFHEAIARASKNQVRVAIMLAIHRALQRASFSLSPLVTSAVQRSIGRELAGIAEAVRERNARLAASRMRRHVRKFSELERQVDAHGD